MTEPAKESARSSDCPVFLPVLMCCPKERRSDMAIKMAKQDTDVQHYRDTVYKELSEMKAKVLDIICKVEATTVSEEARRAEYFDLFDLMDDIEDRLESLTQEHLSDWPDTRKEIEGRRRKLHEAVDWWFGE
jgi:hypothetical protein